MRGSKLWAWASYQFSGVWHRRGIATMLLATTALATGAAMAGFVYRDAAATSGLRGRLVGAPPDDSGIELLAAATPIYQPIQQLDALTPSLPFAAGRISGTSITGSTGPTSRTTSVQLLTSSRVCAQLHMVAGRCPTTGIEAAVPASLQQRLGLRLGQVMKVANLTREPTPVDTDIQGSTVFRSPKLPPAVLRPAVVRVVGVYAVKDPSSSYWFGSPPNTVVTPAQDTPVTVMTTPQVFTEMPHFTIANLFVAQPLRGASVTAADLPRLKAALHQFNGLGSVGRITVVTALPSLLRADAADRGTLDQITTVAVAQLLVLLGLVLVVVVVAGFAARRTETVAAYLQGRHPLMLAADLAVQPILIVLGGAAVGLVLAPAAVRLAGAHWLRAGTPVPWFPVGGAAAGLAVAALGVLAVAAAALRASLLASPTRATADGRSGIPWWETAVFTVAVAGLVELLTAGGVRTHRTPWALLAPTVCGLAVALLVARGLPPLLTPLVKRTRRTSRVAVYLLVRELRRDVNAWRVTAVVAMAVSLLAFAVAIDRGAVVDRRDRAGIIVGAPTVVSINPPSLRNVDQIADRLDPDGQWAMGAVEVVPLASPDERTLAVQSPRLAAVAGWSRLLGGRTPAQIARLLHPSPVHTYVFTSPVIRMHVVDLSRHERPGTRLHFSIADSAGTPKHLVGPVLRRGPQSYRVRAPGCAAGCRLVSFGVPKQSQHFRLDMTIRGIGTGTWSENNLSARLVGGRWHLRGNRVNALLGSETLVKGQYPTPIPVVVTSAASIPVGLDSEQPHAAKAARIPVLPQLLNHGVLADLSYLSLADRGYDAGTTQRYAEIWLGPTAPPDAVSRLRGMGVHVTGVTTINDEVRRLSAQDPALGLDAYLAVAGLAVLLALALLCGQAAVAARRRRAEYVAMATAGVRRLSLGIGWFAAAVVRLAFCVGAGSATGLVFARLAAPGVPLAAPRTVPTPVLSVETWPAVLAAALTLLPLLLSEAFSVRWSIRAASLRRARESAA